MQKDLIIVGIDPGKKGAVAFLPLEGQAAVFDMPEDEYDLVDIFNSFKRKIYRVVIEKQQPFPKQGLSSTFNLARHYGIILGILKTLEIAYEEIPPQKWQKSILGNGRKTRNQSKKASLLKARALFPTVDLANKHGRSDALLIAEYGRRLYFGSVNK